MFRHNRFTGAATRALPYLFMTLLGVTACDRAQPPVGPPHLSTTSQGPDPGGPLADLTAEELALFNSGSIVFQVVFTPENGLGPIFNSTGCANCHENPVVGGSGEAEEEEGGVAGEDIEVHATAFVGDVCNPLADEGGLVFQKQVTDALRAALGITLEVPSAAATAIANRTTPDLFGFGLLDAVPEQTIAALADPSDLDGDGVSGRVHLTPDGHIGRFGRKAQVPRLDDFQAEAFIMEMGITNPGQLLEQYPGEAPGTPLPAGVDPAAEPELTQADLDATNGFVRFLAPAPTLPRQHQEELGQETFHAIGCATCHVPALTTGASSSQALSQQVVFAYTDLLLHDMGPGLADVCVGDARPNEFRTEPLMGLRFAQTFLHDGRTTTAEDAILAHGGEAQGARDQFAALSNMQRRALVKFLESL